MGSKLICLNKNYLLLTIILFIIEVFIALYVRDGFIRPYAGDFLVVILIYCFIRSFLNIPVISLAIGVLLFSFLIETLQYLDLVGMLGLEKNKLAKIVLGSSFEWIDMLAYTLGILTVVGIEKVVRRKEKG